MSVLSQATTAIRSGGGSVASGVSGVRTDIIRAILDGSEEGMPRKYQNAKLEVRRDVARPYYFVRVTIPTITDSGRKLKRTPRTLGFADTISKKEAMKLRAQVLEVVNQGRVLVSSQIKFKDICKRFEDVRLPQLDVGTQSRYRSQIKTHILPAWGEFRMCDIDRAAIEEWLHQKEQSGLGWWSREGLRGVMSSIFKTAKTWKLWQGDNPTQGVRLGKKNPVREKRLLTVEQFRQILAALDDDLKFMVLIMFGTSLRVSETLGLMWRDVDWDNGVVHIRRCWYRGDISEDGETKSENSLRTLQLGPLLEEFRRRYPGPHALDRFVFIGDDGVMPPDDRDLLRYRFRPLLIRLKLYYPGFGWHAFKRQGVTWRQTVGGATPLEAMRTAGHGSLDMTLLYTLADAERERSQVTAMLGKLLETPPGPMQ